MGSQVRQSLAHCPLRLPSPPQEEQGRGQLGQGRGPPRSLARSGGRFL